MTHPSWEQISSAIDKLDRERFPFFSLFCDPEAAEDDIPDLTVMGGRGAFVVGENREFLFFDEHSAEQIEIWLADQGASFPEKFICYDIVLVKSVVRQFAETGRRDPARTWR